MASHPMNTLLCVDDDQEVLDVLQRLFREENYKVLTAIRSEEALKLVESHDIGVVLCDYNMPGMDGVRVLSEIRDRYPDTVRLLLTGETDAQLVIEAVNKGAIFKYIRKSWDRTELIQMVREAFQVVQLTRENSRLTKELQEANKKLRDIKKSLEDRIELKAEQIANLTFYDEITDLPNKTFLMEWLAQVIKQVERNKQTIGVLILGIDRFKKINESLGHSSGDRLLKILVGKIAAYTRQADAFCRISGDMFCIVFHGSGSTKDTSEIADRLLRVVAKPVYIDTEAIYLTASVGISFFPNDGVEPGILLRNAESALNHAKKKGGNIYQYYTEEFNLRAKQHLSLEAELHKAIKNEEFILYYQPRICSRTLKTVGAEALLRW